MLSGLALVTAYAGSFVDWHARRTGDDPDPGPGDNETVESLHSLPRRRPRLRRRPRCGLLHRARDRDRPAPREPRAALAGLVQHPARRLPGRGHPLAAHPRRVRRRASASTPSRRRAAATSSRSTPSASRSRARRRRRSSPRCWPRPSSTCSSRRACSRGPTPAAACRACPTCPSTPAFEFAFIGDHQREVLIAAAVLALVGMILLRWVTKHVRAFWDRVRQGLAILHFPKLLPAPRRAPAVHRLVVPARHGVLPARGLPRERDDRERAARAGRGLHLDPAALHPRRRGGAAGAAGDRAVGRGDALGDPRVLRGRADRRRRWST